jgi:pimeloyl-ACP methyl ester carboxylesterase
MSTVRFPRPKGFRLPKESAPNERTGRAPELGRDATHGYFHSFDGTRLFYSVEGQGKPLIFCYGLVCSSLHWTYQIEHFKNHFQTIWFDYRGHQNSEIPTDMKSLTIEALARDLLALMDELQLKDAVILGHSMGVNVVLEAYRMAPYRFAGLVLANGTPTRPLETLLHTNLLQKGFDLLSAAYERSPELVKKLWKLQKGNPLSKNVIGHLGFNVHLTAMEDIQLYVDLVAEMDPAVLIHLIKNYDHFDAVPWLQTISAPTLILAGERDHIIPIEQQELMAQLIPGSQLEILLHGSHCPQMDLPEQVNRKIEKFIQERVELSNPAWGTASSPNFSSTEEHPRS